MSLLCLLGRHKPLTASLARAPHGGVKALCDGCGVPLERAENGKWRVAEPPAPRR